ncbi:hypothetical protein BLNAU_21066 [Blattamonas nauphoetae]|uniref:Uncharacterized protein n=1 Tax=Blattamonas nauphoetae TaxID=2049346 RepID=A0ABQ9WWY8_9EUKA|nr:hypothetical protein BLNAU_21066 [Blattamonas nauphoetae]
MKSGHRPLALNFQTSRKVLSRLLIPLPTACNVVGFSLYLDHILRIDPSLGFDESPTEEIVNVDLMRKSVVKLPISGATLQGAVLATNLTKELILIAGNSFTTSAVQTGYNTLIDAITPNTLNPPLQKKDQLPHYFVSNAYEPLRMFLPNKQWELPTVGAEDAALLDADDGSEFLVFEMGDEALRMRREEDRNTSKQLMARLKKGKEHVVVGKEARRWADKSKDRISPTSTEEESIAEQLNRVKTSLTIPPTHVTLHSDLLLFATHASDVMSASLLGHHAKETREKQTQKPSADPEHVDISPIHLDFDITARSMLTYSYITSASSTSFPVPRPINSPPTLVVFLSTSFNKTHSPTDLLLVPSSSSCHPILFVDSLTTATFIHQSAFSSLNNSFADVERIPRLFTTRLEEGISSFEILSQSPHTKKESRKKKARPFDIAEAAFQSEIDGIHQNQNRADFQLGVDLGHVLVCLDLDESEEKSLSSNQNRGMSFLWKQLNKRQKTTKLVHPIQLINHSIDFLISVLPGASQPLQTPTISPSSPIVGHSSSSLVVHCIQTVSVLVLPLFCHVSFGNIVVSLQNWMMTTDEHSTSALSLALIVQSVEVSTSRADIHVPIFSVEKNVHSSLMPPQPKGPSSGPSFNQPHLSLVQAYPRIAATSVSFILAKLNRTDRRSSVLQKHLLLSRLIKHVELLFLPAGFVVFDQPIRYRTRTQHESSSVASMIQNAIAPKYDLEQPILRPAQEASEPPSENKEGNFLIQQFRLTQSIRNPLPVFSDFTAFGKQSQSRSISPTQQNVTSLSPPNTYSSSTGSAFQVTDCDSRFGN